jgi:AraC-like DNA-binding protein
VPPPVRLVTAHALADFCRARAQLRSSGVSVRETAARTRLSPFQFIRRFQALFGETPHQLRIAARIDRARRLLALTDRPVTDVCLDVGFSSLGSFSALFARRVGASPSAYRARVRATTRPHDRVATLYPGCLNLMGAAFAILEKQDHGCPEDTGTVAADTRGAARESRCASS